jgi:glycerol-3-phosphate cytidylyltransferase
MNYKKGIICGSFDLIHPGYIRMFKEAKNVCEVLIVALQDDPTVDRPHKCRPVQSLEDRKEILEAIRYVDIIVTYNTEKELLELLNKIFYDVRILGSDYKNNKYTGDKLKKPVYYCERNHNYSTTKLKEAIHKMKKQRS